MIRPRFGTIQRSRTSLRSDRMASAQSDLKWDMIIADPGVSMLIAWLDDFRESNPSCKTIWRPNLIRISFDFAFI